MIRFNNKSFEVPVDGVIFEVVASYEPESHDCPEDLTIEQANIQGRNFIENLADHVVDGFFDHIFRVIKDGEK